MTGPSTSLGPHRQSNLIATRRSNGSFGRLGEVSKIHFVVHFGSLKGLSSVLDGLWGVPWTYRVQFRCTR